MATPRQVQVYNMHRSICQQFGIPQSTLKHKALQGSLSAPSATGNRVYEPPSPGNPSYASQTAVWLATEPIDPTRSFRPGDETPIGRQSIPILRGQVPEIDDNGAAITIQTDDIITDASGMDFRVIDPAATPEASVWTFGMVRLR